MYAIRIETEDGFSEFGENDVAERNKKKTLTLSTENYLWASSYSYTLSDRCSSLCDVSLSLMSVPLCFTAHRCTEMVNAVCLTRLLL